MMLNRTTYREDCRRGETLNQHYRMQSNAPTCESPLLEVYNLKTEYTRCIDK